MSARSGPSFGISRKPEKGDREHADCSRQSWQMSTMANVWGSAASEATASSRTTPNSL
jgi:hypothetical protein